MTASWIVRGDTEDEALQLSRNVISYAVEKELSTSHRIRAMDRGFREYMVKSNLNYNAAFKYSCSYQEIFGASPENHVHPAYQEE